MANLSGMRVPYNERSSLFLEENIEFRDPYHLFGLWFDEVKNNPTIIEPNAVCLATASKDGIPSARFVLCKGYDKGGFRFFTHYTSRKGQELEENPNAALTFYWPPFNRSVRIEGAVEKLPFVDADEYFNCRPYQSQIGALCSDQSQPVEGRHVLTQKEIELRRKYPAGCVPRPELWGGYLVKPTSIEFWQGQTDRIHDRIRFRKPKDESEPDGKITFAAEDDWIYERLAP